MGVGCHFLFQEIFPTQGSNLGLWHCRQLFCYLSHQGVSYGICTQTTTKEEKLIFRVLSLLFVQMSSSKKIDFEILDYFRFMEKLGRCYREFSHTHQQILSRYDGHLGKLN